MTVAAALREVFRTARQTVRSNHLKLTPPAAVAEIFIIVVWYKLIGETLIEQVGVEDAALGDEMSNTYIIVFGQHVDV